MFASKHSVGKSVLDGVGMGLGFTAALLCMAIIREVIGNASFAGIEIPFLQPYKISFFAQPPGGFFVFGVMIALVNVITKGKAPKKKSFSCEDCPSAGACSGVCEAAAESGGESEVS